MSVKCPECKKKCDEEYEFCPHCGHKLEKGTVGGFGYLIGVIFAIYLVYSTRGEDTKNANTEVKKEIEKKPNNKVEQVIPNVKKGSDIKVLQDSWCKLEYSDNGICITIINNSNTDKEYVKVIVDLYDKSGKLIKTISEDMNDLKAEKKWEFGLAAEKGADSYKIKDIDYKEY